MSPRTSRRNYVFGYTIHNDVSDRGGRPPGGFGQGSDWLVGKGARHVRPAGAVDRSGRVLRRPDAAASTCSWRSMASVVQEAKAEDMIHNVWELIEYASSIVTLHPGDVITRHDLRHIDRSLLRRDPLGLSEAGRGDGGQDRRNRHASQPGRWPVRVPRLAAAHSSRRSPATKRD